MNRNPEKFTAYLDQLFEKKGWAGVQVAIRGPKGMVYEHSMGKRSIAENLDVDSETVFGIASMSKSLTALALCILAAEGKMSIDDPVVKYFPNFHVKGNPDSAVTVKTLAMHTAGIPPIEPLEWSIAMNSNRSGEWVERMKAASPNQMDKIEHIIDYITNMPYKTIGAPGEYMSYSNEGYAIMSYIVDKVAGITLEEFLDKRVFGPLGMTRSCLDPYTDRAQALAKGKLTHLFEKQDDGTMSEDENWSTCPPFRGCACVKSTALDMTRYYKCLCDGGKWEGKQVIPAKAVELMIGPQFPLSTQRYYCMGLNKTLINGKMVCEHSGGLHGVSTEGALIEGGYSVTVLCNVGSQDMDPVKWACYNYVMGLPYETEHYWCNPNGLEFSNPEMLAGRFVLHEGDESYLRVTVKEGKIKLHYAGIKTEDVRWCEGTTFAAYSPKTGRRFTTLTFYIRDGKCWGVKAGSRILQRG